MEKDEHAAALRQAMAEQAITPQALADLTGASYRTVGNWTSRSKPTMPRPEDRARLRRLLGNYDAAGDPVERAVRRSELAEWRQDAVLSAYKRNLHEQRAEQAG